jgi:hypothetical protein
MVEFLINLIPAAKWIFAAMLFGIVEAAMFHQCRGRNDKPATGWEDEHIWLTIARLFVFLEIFGVQATIVFNLIAAMLTFPFIHDGFYYVMRNNLDRRLYPARFKAQSTTTDAKFSFEYTTRTILFIGGILIFIVLAVSGL